MTYLELLRTLTEELQNNPEWADKEVGFYTEDGEGPLYYYGADVSSSSDGICIDIGEKA